MGIKNEKKNTPNLSDSLKKLLTPKKKNNITINNIIFHPKSSTSE